MSINLLTKTAGLVASTGIRALMKTLDYRAVFCDTERDPLLGLGRPCIYVFWHEYILLPVYLSGHCRVSILLSRHRDADVLARAALHSGFENIRGSSNRGAATAIRQMMASGKQTHIAITPDGPRGPRRQLAQGPIYLASRLQMPIVAWGFGYDRPWRAKSWDRFAVPRPYSRARIVASGPMTIAPGLDREGIEECRLRVENLMRGLSAEAEAWATAGTRKVGELVTPPQTVRRIMAFDREPVATSPSMVESAMQVFPAA